MTDRNVSATHVVVVEEEVRFTLVELCRACGARAIRESACRPSGRGPLRAQARDHVGDRLDPSCFDVLQHGLGLEVADGLDLG